jgi:hypothetical protein
MRWLQHVWCLVLRRSCRMRMRMVIDGERRRNLAKKSFLEGKKMLLF